MIPEISDNANIELLEQIPSEWRKIQARAKDSISYRKFVEMIEVEIQDVASGLMENPKLYNCVPEETLNNIITMQLVQRGYNATPETASGGHIDILIKRDPNYIYLIEAKWLNSNYSNNHIYEGFNQLRTYSSALKNQTCGLLLIYINKDKPKSRVGKWQEYLINRQQNDKEIIAHHPELTDDYQFITLTTAHQTEMDYQIKHIGIPLYAP